MTASGWLKLVPDYSFGNAPAPKVIVIPAQSGSDAMLEWIRTSAKIADVVMSVCTGAFILAKTGLLAGKAATTHHGSYDRFAMQFRDVKLKRGFRFVESEPNLATAGGLTSGIDLALRVYQGEDWKDSTRATNQAYAKPSNPTSRTACLVCGMTLFSAAPLQSAYKGVTYYFRSDGCKGQFELSPADFVG